MDSQQQWQPSRDTRHTTRTTRKTCTAHTQHAQHAHPPAAAHTTPHYTSKPPTHLGQQVVAQLQVLQAALEGRCAEAGSIRQDVLAQVERTQAWCAWWGAGWCVSRHVWVCAGVLGWRHARRRPDTAVVSPVARPHSVTRGQTACAGAAWSVAAPAARTRQCQQRGLERAEPVGGQVDKLWYVGG
jgi:hypothetical protein